MIYEQNSQRGPSETASYVKQHLHDVRNCLAAMDLQTVLMRRTVDAGSEGMIAKVRKLIGCVEELQLRLGLRFHVPGTAAVSLRAIFENCRERPRVNSDDREIVWAFAGEDCVFLADQQAVCVIILELADHWFARRDGGISAFVRGKDACFQMQRASADEHSVDAEVPAELVDLISRHGGAVEILGHSITIIFSSSSTGCIAGTE